MPEREKRFAISRQGAAARIPTQKVPKESRLHADILDMSSSTLYSWRPDYATGAERIDNQHKQLFDLVNELHDAMMKGKAKDQIQATLDQLISYTLTHFSDEETEMRRAGYPKLAEHIAEHKALTDKVTYYRQALRSGNLAITLEAMRFTGQWLRDHILQRDMDFAKFRETSRGQLAAAGRR